VLQQCSSPQNSLFTVNRHITLRLPSLPLHLALLASRSLALAAALARAFTPTPSPFATFGDLQASQIQRTKKERERELVSPRKGSSPPSPPRSQHPIILSHPIVPCRSAVLGSKIWPAGRRRLRIGTKTGFFRPWRRGLIRSGPGGGVASSPGLIRIGSNDLGGLIGWFRFRRGIGARAVVPWPAGGFVGLGLVRSWGLLVQHTSRRSV